MCYGRYNQLAVGEQPPLRTSENTIANGNKAVRLLGQKGVGALTAGVKGLSAFISLPYFDISTDCTLDMMHITSGVVGRHLVKLITGTRMKAVVTAAKKAEREAAAKTQEQIDADLHAAEEHAQQALEDERTEEDRRETKRAAISAMELKKARAKSQLAKNNIQRAINVAESNEQNRRREVELKVAAEARKHAGVLASRDPPPQVSADFRH